MSAVQKLSELSDEDLEEKITKLQRILYSSNWNLSKQAKPVLMEMLDEQNRRNNLKFEEHLKKYGAKMDEIINIG